MAFNFNWSPLTADEHFYSRARDLLTKALNKSPKPPIIVDDILVDELNLGTVPPDLEILEIGDLAEDRFRGIFKMCYSGDAYLTLKTRVQVCFFFALILLSLLLSLCASLGVWRWASFPASRQRPAGNLGTIATTTHHQMHPSYHLISAFYRWEARRDACGHYRASYWAYRRLCEAALLYLQQVLVAHCRKVLPKSASSLSRLQTRHLRIALPVQSAVRRSPHVFLSASRPPLFSS